jgi:hypothetical protein
MGYPTGGERGAEMYSPAAAALLVVVTSEEASVVNESPLV